MQPKSDGATVASGARLRPNGPDRYRIGIHHVAFEAPSRELVDERLSWVREQGLEIENDPKEYDYHRGIKLEIVHVP